ncbi:hypothetical protein ACFP9V_04350 [Deinococcus radiopugnans]|uniref:hypothetical protein n=1 Tax=Deinococcus radiopugnans TaxID=57497 RepID=UPI003614D882
MRLPRRSAAERRRELEVLARERGWRAHLGSATLGGLVSDFGRTLKRLGPVAPPNAIPLTPPPDFALALGGWPDPWANCTPRSSGFLASSGRRCFSCLARQRRRSGCGGGRSAAI